MGFKAFEQTNLEKLEVKFRNSNSFKGNLCWNQDGMVFARLMLENVKVWLGSYWNDLDLYMVKAAKGMYQN